MLGIYKVHKRTGYFNKWIGSWGTILDCLVGILTLQFYYCTFSDWWVGDGFSFGRDASLKLKARIVYWFADWALLLGEVIPILTLGRFATSWGVTFFGQVS